MTARPEQAPPHEQRVSGTTLRIAELQLALRCVDGDDDGISRLPSAYDRFYCSVPPSEQPDIVVSASRGSVVEVPPADPDAVRCKTDQWVSYRSDGRLVFVFKTVAGPASPWRVAIKERDGRHWRVRTATGEGNGATLPTGRVHPLAFPLAELIYIDALVQRSGLLCHSCGVRDGEVGLLFCGRSGRGKTTIGRLWSAAGATVLSDDRVVVRPSAEGFAVHGTPWHGDLRRVAAAQAPLRAVFFLSHSERTEIERISSSEAVRRLLGTLWQPVWSERAGLGAISNACVPLMRSVPAFTLGLRPEPAALEQIRSVVAALPEQAAR